MTRDEAFGIIQVSLSDSYEKCIKDCQEAQPPSSDRDDEISYWRTARTDLDTRETIGGLFAHMREHGNDIQGAVALSLLSLIDGEVPMDEFADVPIRGWDT